MTEKISPREVEQEIGKDPGYWQFLSDTDPGPEAAPEVQQEWDFWKQEMLGKRNHTGSGKSMKTYTIMSRQYGSFFAPKFAFTADSEKQAEDKLFRWVQYQGRLINDYKLREATENEAVNWLHNEYIPSR